MDIIKLNSKNYFPQLDESMNVFQVPKKSLPFEFGYRNYTIKLKYAKELDLFTVQLLNFNDEIIGQDEFLVLGIPAWNNMMFDDEGNFNTVAPDFHVVALSVDNNEYPVNMDNMNEKVFLCFQDVKLNDEREVIMP